MQDTGREGRVLCALSDIYRIISVISTLTMMSSLGLSSNNRLSVTSGIKIYKITRFSSH